MDDLGDLDPALYLRALQTAGERDSPRTRAIAASDWWVFAQGGGGSEDEAVAALVRGLQSCARRAEGPHAPGSDVRPGRRCHRRPGARDDHS